MTSPNTIIADMQAEIDALRKERDELLAALQKAADTFWKLDDADIHAQEAEAAISSVKGIAQC